MNRLTVTIITLNEEKNLPRALDSVADVADEIVVVDSGSADRTRELARERGARVVERTFTDYSEQKNFAAAQASHEWVLSLDADEELSPELRESVRQWRESEAKAAAYGMQRRAHYIDRWINHSGWYPDPKLRLYRRERARWVGALHEGLQVEGPTGWLEGELRHYTVNSFGQHVRSVRRYTTLAARQLHSAGRRRWLLPFLIAAPWTFVRTLVFQLGFLDGWRGVQIALMASCYVFLKYWKLGVLARGGTLESEGRRT
ncbi:MAG: glycosyltransferase family 2 protein [Candidatus Acidiferrales bacterium]